MPDYSVSKIYKIWDVNYTKCYVGSTVSKLYKRFSQHKGKYRDYLNNKYHYTTVFSIFDEFGVENCKIELVEECNANTKEELLAREGQYIRECQCVNKCIAGRTNKKYIKEFPEWNKQWQKQHYEKNKCERLEYMREYRTNNPEKVKESKAKWYQEKRLIKYTCGCGSTVPCIKQKAHEKTNKHQQYLQNQTNPQE